MSPLHLESGDLVLLLYLHYALNPSRFWGLTFEGEEKIQQHEFYVTRQPVGQTYSNPCSSSKEPWSTA